VNRDESVSRILKQPMAAVTKHQKSSSTLGFGVKASQSVVKFSRG
jgi:hypothetical protein